MLDLFPFRNLLIIYSTNSLRIYFLPSWRNMIFWTADFADEADFTQIGFLDAQAHEFLRIGWRKMFLETNLS